MARDTDPRTLEKKVSEIRNVAISFVGLLDAGELLTGTPTILEVTTTDLILANKVVNTAQLTINGRKVATGQAIQFTVSVGLADTSYEIRVTIDTDATPAQTLIIKIRLKVKAD